MEQEIQSLDVGGMDGPLQVAGNHFYYYLEVDGSAAFRRLSFDSQHLGTLTFSDFKERSAFVQPHILNPELPPIPTLPNDFGWPLICPDGTKVAYRSSQGLCIAPTEKGQFSGHLIRMHIRHFIWTTDSDHLYYLRYSAEVREIECAFSTVLQVMITFYRLVQLHCAAGIGTETVIWQGLAGPVVELKLVCAMRYFLSILEF